MQRDEIINSLIEKFGFKRYLEIGIGDGLNYQRIECEYKTNVDPFFDKRSGQTDHFLPINMMTSDEFFASNKEKFDIIFVDGLHTFEQTLTDIMNSLECLNEGGIVIAHDMLPPTEWHQRDSNEKEGGEWNGTCWKAVAYLRTTNPNLTIHTVDSDWGTAIIRKGESKLFEKKFDEIDYSFFRSNKWELMNIISVEKFKDIYVKGNI